MAPRKKTPETFESKLLKMEELVKKMESGDLSLSDNLAAYEEGMKLSKELTEELNGAETRMQEIVNGSVVDMEDAP